MTENEMRALIAEYQRQIHLLIQQLAEARITQPAVSQPEKLEFPLPAVPIIPEAPQGTYVYAAPWPPHGVEWPRTITTTTITNVDPKDKP